VASSWILFFSYTPDNYCQRGLFTQFAFSGRDGVGGSSQYTYRNANNNHGYYSAHFTRSILGLFQTRCFVGIPDCSTILEIYTENTFRILVFWDVMLCSVLLNTCRRFEETWRRHPHRVVGLRRVIPTDQPLKTKTLRRFSTSDVLNCLLIQR